MGRIYRRSWRRRKALALSLGVGVAAAFVLPAFGQDGDDAGSVEIDANADLTRNGGGLNRGACDWVHDTLPDDADGDCLDGDGVVLCNQPGVTAHADGVGHWTGVRVVDSAGLGETNIFLGGSRFADPGSWKIGAGDLGGNTYDAGQAYITNSAGALFMAMERLGFAGSTAWDFEFNAMPPDPRSPYTPVRTAGDKLFVFQIDGSGGSGLVDIHLYQWDGAGFVPIATPAGTWASINDTDVDAGPWGFRDTRGQWQLGKLHALTFAEVALPTGPRGISLPVDPTRCSQKAYVAIRTRASSEFTSDMKDALPIFEYQFAGLTVAAARTAESASELAVTVTGYVTGGDPDRQWQRYNYATGGWDDIAGETGATLTLTSADWTAPYIDSRTIAAPFVVDGDDYVGRALTSRVRLEVSQTTAGTRCTLDSNAVTLRQLVAVDS